jgi:DNA-binding MarR family transcriptional regulator
MASSSALTDAERQTWATFYTMRRRLDRALDLQLQRDSGLSASEYEILQAIHDATGRGLRITAIAEAIGWEKSRVSHLVTRMEKRELLDRTECDVDARGSWIGLTVSGRRALLGASRGHSAAIRRYFLEVLDPMDAASLESLSARVVGAIGCAADEDAPQPVTDDEPKQKIA